MAIHQEDLAPVCTKKRCKHKNEYLTFTPDCHAKLMDPQSKVEVNNLAVKAIYSLETKELVLKCLICDEVVTVFAVAHRPPDWKPQVKNGSAGPASPAPRPKGAATPGTTPQSMTRKAKLNRQRRR
jgi:hypothetical protein